jgi:uncharacterized membrane protein YidH (DUF202 family)
VGIGTSIALIVIGAILRFAITTDASIGDTTVNWDVIGVILIVAGVLGLLISLYWMQRATSRHRDVVDERVTTTTRDRDRYTT